MSRCVALERRNIACFALVSLVGVWLSGCSSDATRLSAASGDPFTNPFSTASNDRPTATPSVSSQPLPGTVSDAYAVPAHPSPTGVASSTKSAPTMTGAIAPPKAEAVGGSAAGWSAVGGTPVIVVAGDTVDSLSHRYGVPTAALLGANGLKSPSQVHEGMRIVIPVYSVKGKTASEPTPVPTASEPKKRHGLDVAKADDDDADDSASKAKAKAKRTKDDAADEPARSRKDKAKAKAEPDKKVAEAKEGKAGQRAESQVRQGQGGESGQV